MVCVLDKGAPLPLLDMRTPFADSALAATARSMKDASNVTYIVNYFRATDFRMVAFDVARRVGWVQTKRRRTVSVSIQPTFTPRRSSVTETAPLPVLRVSGGQPAYREDVIDQIERAPQTLMKRKQRGGRIVRFGRFVKSLRWWR
jgi:hypothetical protein